MISWTTPAKEEIDSYLNNVRASIATSGADASEVIDDLKRHIEEEVHTARLETVTRDDVRRIVHRLGLPDTRGGVAVAEPLSPPHTVETRNGHHAPRPKASQPGVFVLICGVILPLITLGVEFFTHFCASVFFDPIPSYWHVLAVAVVPFSNFLIWRAVRRRAETRWNALAWVNGIAAGVGLFFTLRYAVLLPPAFFALIIYGMGLLPLTPLLAFISTLRLRRHLTRVCPAPRRSLALGMLMGFALIAALDAPVLVTYAGMSMANADLARTRAKGIRLLRMFGNNEVMLRDCYGRTRGGIGFDVYRSAFGQPVGPEAAREIYYRVNGEPFNAAPPPSVFTTQGRWTAAEREFTWDNDQCGEAVAGRVKGLSLLSSRMDGIVDADGVVGYLEWTLEFKNVSPMQREARAQIALPPGGVVSRLTLWVNGEEREAAFSGRGEVRQAYQNVVAQRRDPVLVTSAGPDRVLMQCFPVPTDGIIKVRLGVTAPIEILDDRNALVAMPCFLERNFTIGEDFEHSVWLESKAALAASDLATGRNAEGAFTLRGEVGDVAFSTLKVSRATPWPTAVASDPRRPGHFVRQTVAQTAAKSVEHAYFVIDTSVSMDRHLSHMAEAFKTLPPNIRATLLLPGDESVEVIVLNNTQALIRRVRRISAVGGKDNLPAVLRAWDMAATNANSVVVWVHGAQPSVSRVLEQMRQRLDWRGRATSIIDVPVEPAPNRLLEKLEGVPALRTLTRTKSLSADLGRLFASWSPGAKAFQITRESVDAPGAEARGSSHVARLWAFEQIQQLIRGRKTPEAVKVAGLYQLVMPVSGAVVLETRQQFEQAGLNPVDANTVPTVPEPSTWVLMALGLAALLYRKFFPSTARTGK